MTNVHDLHIWTITSGFPALSAPVLVERGLDCHAKRRELERLLEESFHIDRTTLQVDHESERLYHIATEKQGSKKSSSAVTRCSRAGIAADWTTRAPKGRRRPALRALRFKPRPSGSVRRRPR